MDTFHLKDGKPNVVKGPTICFTAGGIPFEININLAGVNIQEGTFRVEMKNSEPQIQKSNCDDVMNPHLGSRTNSIVLEESKDSGHSSPTDLRPSEIPPAPSAHPLTPVLIETFQGVPSNTIIDSGYGTRKILPEAGPSRPRSPDQVQTVSKNQAKRVLEEEDSDNDFDYNLLFDQLLETEQLFNNISVIAPPNIEQNSTGNSQNLVRVHTEEEEEEEASHIQVEITSEIPGPSNQVQPPVFKKPKEPKRYLEGITPGTHVKKNAFGEREKRKAQKKAQRQLKAKPTAVTAEAPAPSERPRRFGTSKNFSDYEVEVFPKRPKSAAETQSSNSNSERPRRLCASSKVFYESDEVEVSPKRPKSAVETPSNSNSERPRRLCASSKVFYESDDDEVVPEGPKRKGQSKTSQKEPLDSEEMDWNWREAPEEIRKVGLVEEKDNGAAIYYVEKVLDVKFKNDKKYYLIKWEGWPESYNSWESEGVETDEYDLMRSSRIQTLCDSTPQSNDQENCIRNCLDILRI